MSNLQWAARLAKLAVVLSAAGILAAFRNELELSLALWGGSLVLFVGSVYFELKRP
jgi:hypothetical protein